MLNNTLIISNNKLVKEDLSIYAEVMLVEGSLLQTMEQTRDLIHKGYILLTHPLSGSIKPNETPYKSIAVEKRQGPVDTASLEIIEQSIARTKSLLEYRNTPHWPEKYLMDFRVIDLDLIRNALKL
ncbi:MAG: GrdX family protein [Clostridia bacterium]